MVLVMRIVFPILEYLDLGGSVLSEVAVLILLLLLLYLEKLPTHHLGFLHALGFLLKTSWLGSITFLTHRPSTAFVSI